MQATIREALSQREVKDEEVTRWANSEATPVVRAIRDVVNRRFEDIVTFTTDGSGSYQSVWTSPVLPTNSTTAIRLSLVMFRSNAYAAIDLLSVAHRKASTAAVVTASNGTQVKAPTASSFNLRIVGNTDGTYSVEVQDVASFDMRAKLIISELQVEG